MESKRWNQDEQEWVKSIMNKDWVKQLNEPISWDELVKEYRIIRDHRIKNNQSQDGKTNL
jgi:hypothetical protein